MRIEINQKKVLETINKLSPATLKDIATSLEINQMFVSGYLSALEHVQKIESKVVGTTIIYIIKGDN